MKRKARDRVLLKALGAAVITHSEQGFVVGIDRFLESPGLPDVFGAAVEYALDALRGTPLEWDPDAIGSEMIRWLRS